MVRWTLRWSILAMVLALAAAPVPAMAGTPSVAGTIWSGPAKLVMKVRGEGTVRLERVCSVEFREDGVFRAACSGEDREDVSEYTWEQKGRRIVIHSPTEEVEGELAGAYEHVTGREDDVDVVSPRDRTRAKIRPKKGEMKFSLRFRGKVVTDSGKKYRTTLIVKGKHWSQED